MVLGTLADGLKALPFTARRLSRLGVHPSSGFIRVFLTIRAARFRSSLAPRLCRSAPGLILWPCLRIFLNPQLPCRLQGTGQDVFARGCQKNVGRAHSSPAAGDREKNLREFLDKRRLLIGCEHQVPVPLLGRRERRKDSAAYAEVGIPHMRAFFGAVKSKSNPSEVLNVHE